MLEVGVWGWVFGSIYRNLGISAFWIFGDCQGEGRISRINNAIAMR